MGRVLESTMRRLNHTTFNHARLYRVKPRRTLSGGAFLCVRYFQCMARSFALICKPRFMLKKEPRFLTAKPH